MNKDVIILGIVSFINDTASKIILPILPLFIQQLGGGGFAIGLISGLGETVASVCYFLSGVWSDLMGRRKIFIFWGYIISAFSKGLFAFAQSWPQVLVFKLGERVGKGFRDAPRDAMLAGHMKKHGKTFGVHRALESSGAVLGGVVVLFLLWVLGFNFRSAFILAGFLSLFCIIPLIFVREPNIKPQKVDFWLCLHCLSPSLKLFLFIATLFSLGNFSYMFFVLKSQSIFAGANAVIWPIILYTIYNVSYSLFAIPFGYWSDRVGRKGVLILGYALFGAVCLGFLFAHSLWAFITLFALLGLNYAMVNSNERAFVADLAPKDHRATALGIFHMFTSLAILPGGLIAGYLWDISPLFTFVYGIVISVVAFHLLAFWIRK